MSNPHVEQAHGQGNLRGHKPAGRIQAKKSVEACAYCGEKDEVIPILYGFPSHAAFMRAERGEVFLGGCEVSPYGFYCKRCDREF